jgi:hypothetical protein
MLGISPGSLQNILKDNLNMCQMTAKFVPHLPNEQQKDNHVNTCKDLQGRLKRDPEFLSNIITGDEMWVYRYDPETKQQSPQ